MTVIKEQFQVVFKNWAWFSGKENVTFFSDVRLLKGKLKYSYAVCESLRFTHFIFVFLYSGFE